MAGALRKIFATFARSYPKPVAQFLPRLYSNVPTPYEIVDAQEERKTYQGETNLANFVLT